MGRAIIILCSLIFTLIPLSQIEGTEKNLSSWESFITQYNWLVMDEKYELADRLLNNRLPEMEQYVQTLSPRHQDTWRQLNETPAINSETKRSEQIIVFIEIFTSSQPHEIVREKLEVLSSSIENPQNSSLELNELWENISPAVSTIYEAEVVDTAKVSFNKLTVKDSMNERKQLIAHLNKIKQTDDGIAGDAVIWTAFIVGGTILITLLYVSLRQFKSRSKIRHMVKSDNS
ncbi:hypothetical protein [Halobacillus litoralis]|uniref:Sporulation protein YpjB n=1 Tax=Halobacillus litoralis TaxID=45668 RepID=A0A410M865_9BACI|nr:hypothetical protein [Halobacillus litoralis]QAS50796.1 hypothetical protein HLI_00560 [Halobacillus litoralis]